MHYGGHKTDCLKFQNQSYMTLKPNEQEIPENKELSFLDIRTLKQIFAAPG